MRDDQTDIDAPGPIVPAESPLRPRHLIDLFLAPGRFFTSRLALGSTPYLLPVIYLFGVAATLDRTELRIQRNLIAILVRGGPRPAWRLLEPLASNWLYFWAYGLVVGVLSALLVWWIMGWWFRVRVRWSGDVNPDRRTARLVYVYAALVWTIPYLGRMLGGSLAYDDYLAWTDANTSWDLMFLVFPLWSALAGYKGVTRVFDVKRTRALIWFLILPSLLHLLTHGGMGALRHFLFNPQPGAG